MTLNKEGREGPARRLVVEVARYWSESQKEGVSGEKKQASPRALGLTLVTLAAGLGIALFPVPARSEAWSAAEMTAFIVAASWCSKEEGIMTRQASIEFGADLLKWLEREFGYSREQISRIGRDEGFSERWKGLIRSYGGCRGLLNEVYRKTGSR